jgi:hypothetical protein
MNSLSPGPAPRFFDGVRTAFRNAVSKAKSSTHWQIKAPGEMHCDFYLEGCSNSGDQFTELRNPDHLHKLAYSVSHSHVPASEQ